MILIARRAKVIVGAAILGLGLPVQLLALDPAKGLTQYNLQVWTTEHGLPQESVNCIAQTPDGYLWVGTRNGLARFDGVTFTTFNRNNTKAMAVDNIQAMTVGRDGTLWFGDGGNLVRYKGGVFEAVIANSTSGEIITLFEDSKAQLWIGTWAALFQYKDGKVQTSYTMKDGLVSNAMKDLAEDKEGSLWIGGTRGVTRMRNGEFTIFNKDNGLSAPDVLSLYGDSRGAVWMGTVEGLTRYQGGTMTSFHVGDGLASERVEVLYEDRDGNLWVGTWGGLTRFRAGRFVSLRADDGLPSDYVQALFEDREGSLWIGTRGGGLARLKDGAFTPYTKQEGLASNFVKAVTQAKDGALFVATNGGGVSRLKDGLFTNYTAADGLAFNSYWSLAADRDGSLWMGTGEVTALQRRGADGKLTTYRGMTELGGWGIRTILQTRDGAIWVATNGGGLTRLKDGQLTNYRPPTIPSLFIYALVEDREGTLWIGSQLGVTRLKDGEFKTFDEKTGLCQRSAGSLYEDAAGDLWAGTGGGLSRWKGDGFRCYTTDQGLFDNHVLGIVEDDHGYLWFGTINGVARVARADFDAIDRGERTTVRSFSYGVADGMETNQCEGDTHSSAYKTRDGRLWFATIRGLVSVDPANLKTNLLVPPVHVEKVTVDRRSVDLEAGAPPGKGEVEIQYTALSLLAPQKVLFRYKLEPFDRDWVEAGARRMAYYTNVPPGRYTFRVIGANNDGVWNMEGAAITFVLQPHFYQTTLFKAFCLLAAGFAGFRAYEHRVKQLKVREVELTTKVEQRTNELTQQIAVRDRLEQDLRKENQDRRDAEEKLREHATDLEGTNRRLDESRRQLELENDERRRAELAAQHERDLLRALMDNIPDLIYFKDPDGKFTRVNRALANMVGAQDPEQVVGRRHGDFFGGEDVAASRVDEARLVQTGKAMIGSVEQVTARSGATFWLLTTKVPLKDRDGRVSGLVGISKDITDRKKAEEELNRNLEAFLKIVSSAAEGDLSRRGATGEDTLGRIAHSVNRMLESVSTILARVKTIAFDVHTAAGEILLASRNIATGAQRQTDEMHGTSSAVDELSASMNAVLKSAATSLEAARQAFGHVQVGDEAVGDTAVAMSRIDTAAEETAAKMKLLGDRSKQIAQIVDRIDDIASQSKLLALNAAIEAAHAGEAGRGFGVVAEEVGKLAEQSRQATSDIAEIIEHVQEETTGALTATENAARQVKEGGQLAEKARRALRDVSQAVGQSSALSEHISLASEEQARITRDVATAMQTILSITLDSASGADQTMHTVQGLVSLSDDLNKAIAEFKISDTP